MTAAGDEHSLIWKALNCLKFPKNKFLEILQTWTPESWPKPCETHLTFLKCHSKLLPLGYERRDTATFHLLSIARHNCRKFDAQFDVIPDVNAKHGFGRTFSGEKNFASALGES